MVQTVLILGAVVGALADCTINFYGGGRNCYMDSSKQPILELPAGGIPPSGFTLELCAAKCQQMNPKYLVIGVSSGYSCSCGEYPDLPDKQSTGCDLKCDGNHDEICGGPGMLTTLYSLKCRIGPAPPPGTSDQPPGPGLSSTIFKLLLAAIFTAVIAFVIVILINTFIFKKEGDDRIPGYRYASQMVSRLRSNEDYMSGA